MLEQNIAAKEGMRVASDNGLVGGIIPPHTKNSMSVNVFLVVL